VSITITYTKGPLRPLKKDRKTMSGLNSKHLFLFSCPAQGSANPMSPREEREHAWGANEEKLKVPGSLREFPPMLFWSLYPLFSFQEGDWQDRLQISAFPT
jgi:hypothetical protein